MRELAAYAPALRKLKQSHFVAAMPWVDRKFEWVQRVIAGADAQITARWFYRERLEGAKTQRVLIPRCRYARGDGLIAQYHRDRREKDVGC
jgi:hypothetical protein